jgi:hypothetical protein
MGKASGRNRQERRLVDKTLHPDPVRDAMLHAPEGCPDCIEDPQTVVFNDFNQVVLRMQLHGHKLVDFAMIQQHRQSLDHAWIDVLVADCQHEELHVHRCDSTGRRSSRTSVMSITSADDVEAAYLKASDLVFEQWEENLRRCRDGG